MNRLTIFIIFILSACAVKKLPYKPGIYRIVGVQNTIDYSIEDIGKDTMYYFLLLHKTKKHSSRASFEIRRSSSGVKYNYSYCKSFDNKGNIYTDSLSKYCYSKGSLRVQDNTFICSWAEGKINLVFELFNDSNGANFKYLFNILNSKCTIEKSKSNYFVLKSDLIKDFQILILPI